SDGKLSPGESDADCGGHCPTKCNDGKSCSLNEDCGESLQCISSICKICEENDKNCNDIPDEQETSGVKDTDNDGMPDEWEIQNDLNPNDPNDADLDPDKDGLTNIEEFNVQREYSRSTNPNLADTDSDGFNDKEEIDKGTSPVDPEDFPKSSFAKILAFVFGILVLVSGFGYLAYKAAAKKKMAFEKFELPVQKEAQKTKPQQPLKQTQEIKKEEAQIKDDLKRKEEQKRKEREKLFGAFGKDVKEAKAEKQPEEKPARKEKSESRSKSARPHTAGKRLKTQAKKSKEDVFAKLKEIASERKPKRPHGSKIKTQDKIERLYELAKTKAKKGK
ncbi:hypothetical protein HYY71_02520, partial [Candidatus Woesearchaeota archaeon]|nr:hypothetical protein [Candidatus Woesearchaeota archaeon]